MKWVPCILALMAAVAVVAQDKRDSRIKIKTVKEYSIPPKAVLQMLKTLPVLKLRPSAPVSACGTIGILPIPTDKDYTIGQVKPDTSKLAPMPQLKGLPACPSSVPKIVETPLSK